MTCTCGQPYGTVNIQTDQRYTTAPYMPLYHKECYRNKCESCECRTCADRNNCDTRIAKCSFCKFTYYWTGGVTYQI